MKRGVVIGVLLMVVMQSSIAEADVAEAPGGALPEESSPDAWIAIAIIFLVLFVGAVLAALRAQRKEMMREPQQR